VGSELVAQAATHNRQHNSNILTKILKNPTFISRFFLLILQWSYGNLLRRSFATKVISAGWVVKVRLNTNQARRWPAGRIRIRCSKMRIAGRGFYPGEFMNHLSPYQT
jgi:hypothetical protein